MKRGLVKLAACVVLVRPDATLAPTLAVPVAVTTKPSPKKPSPKKPAPPLAPLGMLPSVARVRVEVLQDDVLIVEDVNLPRGEYERGPLDFYVAFGAPGPPSAIDAHLVPVLDGAVEASDATPGEKLATTRAPRRPSTAHPLLGRDTMTGIVVHVPPASFARALAPGNMAALRLRSVVRWSDADVDGARGLVVRLGASRGTPLTLGRIVVTHRPGAPAVVRAEARLCGPDAESRPLAVRVSGRARPSDGGEPPIAPVLAVRHATDDLCLRLWTAPESP